MASEHETQRARNAETVKLQEESSLRVEYAKQQVQEQIEQRRQATLAAQQAFEEKSLRAKALAEKEGDGNNERRNEEVHRRRDREAARAYWEGMSGVVEQVRGRPRPSGGLVRERSNRHRCLPTSARAVLRCSAIPKRAFVW